MQLAERFHKPENFDAVADGAGWVLYCGANDWESGVTAVAVSFPSDEEIHRIWFTVKHKYNPDSGGKGSTEHADEVKEWGDKAWRTWKREATAQYRNKNNSTRSWRDAFKLALHSKAMKPFVKEHGTERTKWDDVKENAARVVNGLLEDDPDEPDLDYWGKRLSVEEQLNELFGRWMPHFKNDPRGTHGKRWGTWFKLGQYEVWVMFTLLFHKNREPTGHLSYEIKVGDWQHHNSEHVAGEANILKMVEIFKESVEKLKTKPPTKTTEVVAAMERPLSYAYGVERYGDQDNYPP